MNRKHNPMVALGALILLAVVLTWICTGCSAEAEAAEEASRFTTEYVGNRCTIITDNETGAEYLYYKGYGAGGLTKLEVDHAD
jgi:hypothetical protein